MGKRDTYLVVIQGSLRQHVPSVIRSGSARLPQAIYRKSSFGRVVCFSLSVFVDVLTHNVHSLADLTGKTATVEGSGLAGYVLKEVIPKWLLVVQNRGSNCHSLGLRISKYLPPRLINIWDFFSSIRRLR